MNPPRATNQVSLWHQKVWAGHANDVMTITESKHAVTAIYVVDAAIKRMMEKKK